MFRLSPTWIAAICIGACLALGGNAQDVSPNIRSRTPARAPDFRLESDLVLVPVNVTDSKNHVVTDLKREAFHVFEDKVEQSVVQFAREDAPLSIGIVFDSSESMTGKLDKSREAMKQFLSFANPEDEFFLVEFSTHARVTVPLTNDSDDIQNRLLSAQPKGKTALLDAVCLAMENLKHARYSRRALLILSDGGDNDSRYTEREICDRVRESDLWIYAMGIYLEGARSPEAKEGEKLLEGLTGVSGGRHFAVESLVELPVVAARISLELRNQYVLGYRPNTAHRDGKFHQVSVSVSDGQHLQVSWRPGYYGTLP